MGTPVNRFAEIIGELSGEVRSELVYEHGVSSDDARTLIVHTLLTAAIAMLSTERPADFTWEAMEDELQASVGRCFDKVSQEMRDNEPWSLKDSMP